MAWPPAFTLLTPHFCVAPVPLLFTPGAPPPAAAHSETQPRPARPPSSGFGLPARQPAHRGTLPHLSRAPPLARRQAALGVRPSRAPRRRSPHAECTRSRGCRSIAHHRRARLQRLLRGRGRRRCRRTTGRRRPPRRSTPFAPASQPARREGPPPSRATIHHLPLPWPPPREVLAASTKDTGAKATRRVSE